MQENIVIKIFGIYTHAQLDKRLWDSISAQLCRKGKEYRDRCVWRNKPVNTGDNVFTPASFPALEATLEVDTSRVPSLPDDTLEEVCGSRPSVSYRTKLYKVHSLLVFVPYPLIHC